MGCKGTLETNLGQVDLNKKVLVIEYEGHIDRVACPYFRNIRWGDGRIELANFDPGVLVSKIMRLQYQTENKQDKVGALLVLYEERLPSGPGGGYVVKLHEIKVTRSKKGDSFDMQIPADPRGSGPPQIPIRWFNNQSSQTPKWTRAELVADAGEYAVTLGTGSENSWHASADYHAGVGGVASRPS